MSFNTQAQTISIFAGGGKVSGDGIPATAAIISDPGSGVFDKYGNYYFADLGAKRVRKIDTMEIIITVAGGGTGGDGGPATAAKLNAPDAVKLDTSGNLIIADGGNNNIRKVDITTGIISTIAGTGTGAYGGDNGPATAARLNDPQDVAIDKWDNIYIADGYNSVVRKIDASGVITTYAGIGGTAGSSGDGGPATVAKLEVPTGLAVDSNGTLYIADFDVNRVRKVDTSGIITNVAGNGIYTFAGDGIPATNAQINPVSIAIDSLGNLFITDQYNERVYKIDIMGILHTVAGDGIAGGKGDGGPATAAEIYWPTGIALDACGNIYIPEAGTVSIPDSFRNIRKVTFNPTCDPYNHGTTDSSSLSVNAITTNNITIYPNPATAMLSITASNKITQITISNLIGQTIYTSPGLCEGEEKEEVNISGLPEGMYIIKVMDSEGREIVTKIIKQ